MKKNILFYTIYCIGLFTISACKTDPKVEPTIAAITKESTVFVRLRAEPDNLNPMLTTKGHATQVCHYMFPTLLDYDPFTKKLSPVLVKSRPKVEEITEGERKGWTGYFYEILDEAVWDDGSPVTGNDYLFTMKTLFNPHVGSGPYRPYLSLIKDIAIDPANPKKYTVYTDEKYIKAEYATGLFIYPQYKFDPDKVMDSYTYADIRDPAKEEQYKNDEILKSFGETFNSPMFSRDPEFVGGCGAYKLEEWIEGERVVLVKKDNWWGDKIKDKYPMLTAYPKRIVFKPISDATTALTLMKNQELDVITVIPEDQFLEFKESEIGKQSINFHTPDAFVYNYYGLNTKRPKLSDKRVRHALAHLFDRDEVFRTVSPFAEPIIGPFHPMRSYYNNDLKPIQLDVEKAKKLLAEAGWKDTNNNGTLDKVIDGESLEMELDLLITPSNKVSSSMGLIFQNEARKAGVRINVVEKDAAALFAQLRSRDFDIYALAASAELSIDDPKQFWHTESDVPSGQNRFGFGNAESDKLIDDIRSELDETKRDVLFKKLQKIIYDEQPAIFLYVTKNRIAVNKKFKGVEMTIKSPGFFVNYWYE
ncbi:MAG: peptide/nickel transport system substrate-binding protein [Saprospiraceae bacterium]|jgi:peptide/nickel transport system substrate-binding protein